MRMPVLFVSHGAPSLLFEEVPARDFLRGLAATLPAPRAIVVVSAHWQEPAVRVGSQSVNETIHDFAGFGPALERWRYAAPGAPELAREIVTRLTMAEIPTLPASRGLDHGAWVPLSLIWPQATIPVVPVALTHGDEAEHLALGQALAPLRDEGVLILTTGAATHPLAAAIPGSDQPPAWVAAFDQALSTAVVNHDLTVLAGWRRFPDARRTHPTPEHLLPLFVALGAAGPTAKVECLHQSWTWGVLAMRTWRWE